MQWNEIWEWVFSGAYFPQGLIKSILQLLGVVFPLTNPKPLLSKDLCPKVIKPLRAYLIIVYENNFEK